MKLTLEPDLLDSLKKNNLETFSTIYDSYAPAIFGIICNQVSEKKVAEEILQNVFLTFNNEVKTRTCISEGIFICLYRITRKLTCEKATVPLIAPKEVYLTQAVASQ
jgi:RNA polymerase sigma-70 factor (ECF subfamily)